MFNKPNLFPKPSDTPAARMPSRPAGAGAVDTSAPREAAATAQSPAGSVRTQPAREEPAVGGSRLIVGPEVKLKGAEILDCDTLVVEGRVSATMDSRVLRIAASGAFEGKVGVDIAEIHGRFDGELTAREQLLIHAGGRVSGKIRYGTILIEEGGQICGDISADDAERKPAKPFSAAAAEPPKEEAAA